MNSQVAFNLNQVSEESQENGINLDMNELEGSSSNPHHEYTQQTQVSPQGIAFVKQPQLRAQSLLSLPKSPPTTLSYSINNKNQKISSLAQISPSFQNQKNSLSQAKYNTFQQQHNRNSSQIATASNSTSNSKKIAQQLFKDTFNDLNQFLPINLEEFKGVQSYSGCSTPSQSFFQQSRSQTQHDQLFSQQGNKPINYHKDNYIISTRKMSQNQGQLNNLLSKNHSKENIQSDQFTDNILSRRSSDFQSRKSVSQKIYQNMINKNKNQGSGDAQKSNRTNSVRSEDLLVNSQEQKFVENNTSKQPISLQIERKYLPKNGYLQSYSHLSELEDKRPVQDWRPKSQSLYSSPQNRLTFDPHPHPQLKNKEYQKEVQKNQSKPILEQQPHKKAEFISLDRKPAEIEFQNVNDQKKNNKFQHFNANFLGKQLTLNNKTSLKWMLKPGQTPKLDSKVYEKFKKQMKDSQLQNLVKKDKDKQIDDKAQSPHSIDINFRKYQQNEGEIKIKNPNNQSNPIPPSTAPMNSNRWKYNKNIETKNKDEYKTSSSKSDFFFLKLRMKSNQSSRLYDQLLNPKFSSSTSSRALASTSPDLFDKQGSQRFKFRKVTEMGGQQGEMEVTKQSEKDQEKQSFSNDIHNQQYTRLSPQNLNSIENAKSQRSKQSHLKKQQLNKIIMYNLKAKEKTKTPIFGKNQDEVLQLIGRTLENEISTDFCLRFILQESELAPHKFLNLFSLFLSNTFSSIIPSSSLIAQASDQSKINYSECKKHILQPNYKLSNHSKLVSYSLKSGILADFSISLELQDYLRKKIIQIITFSGSDEEEAFNQHLKQQMSIFLKKKEIVSDLGVLEMRRLVSQTLTHFQNTYLIVLSPEFEEYFFDLISEQQFCASNSQPKLSNVPGNLIQFTSSQLFFLKQSAKCVCQRLQINIRTSLSFLERIESLRALLCSDTVLNQQNITFSFAQKRQAAQKFQETSICSFFQNQDFNTQSNALIIVSCLIDICSISNIERNKNTSNIQNPLVSHLNSDNQQQNQVSLIEFYNMIMSKFTKEGIEDGLLDLMKQFAKSYIFKANEPLYIELSRKLDQIKHLHNQSLSPIFLSLPHFRRQQINFLLFKYLEKIQKGILPDNLNSQSKKQQIKQIQLSFQQPNEESVKNTSLKIFSNKKVPPIKINLILNKYSSQQPSPTHSSPLKIQSRSLMDPPNSPTKTYSSKKQLNELNTLSGIYSNKNILSEESIKFPTDNENDSNFEEQEHCCLSKDDPLMLFKYLIDFSWSFMDIYSVKDIYEAINISKITKDQFEEQLKHAGLYLKEQLSIPESNITKQLNYLRTYSLLYDN